MNGNVVTVEQGVSIQHTTEGSSLLHPNAKGGLPPPKIKTYPWRWVVLAVFTLNNAITNYVWIMSAVIADLMSCYYGVSQTWVNLLSTSFMMSYVVLMWPGVWVMDRFGLRLPVVVSSGLVAMGAALRVIGTGLFVCLFVLFFVCLFVAFVCLFCIFSNVPRPQA